MLWVLGVVSAEPLREFVLKPESVNDCHIHCIIHKFLLEGPIESLDVGVDFWGTRRTPQVNKMQPLHGFIKRRMELAAVVCVDGMNRIREVCQDAFEKACCRDTG